MGMVCVLGGRNATSRGFCVVESVRRRGSSEGKCEGGATVEYADDRGVGLLVAIQVTHCRNG